MEPLVNEIIKNHEIDRDLTGEKVQEEVKNLRQKHNRVNDSLEENEQLVGLDWKNENLRKFNFEGIILSKEEPENQAHFEDADLLKANFRNADLSYAWLNQANVRRAKFDGCNFEGLDWQDASYFEDAIISHIDESNINEAKRIYFD